MKIGYVNVDYVLSQLSDTKEVHEALKEHDLQLQEQLKAKGADFQVKVKEFNSSSESLLPEVRIDKEKELQSLQRSIQEFQNDAQQSLQKKRSELLSPLYAKVQKGIDEVSKQENYTHVFGSHAGNVPILLYAEKQYDIGDSVLRHLGVEPKPKK